MEIIVTTHFALEKSNNQNYAYAFTQTRLKTVENYEST